MSNFRLGDQCIGINAQWNLERNGMECVVIEGLADREYYGRNRKDVHRAPCYVVRWADGSESCARPHQLKKQEPGNWESCLWRPTHVTVSGA